MKTIPINDRWEFTACPKEDFLSGLAAPADVCTVTLPHTVKELPLHYCNEEDYQGVFGYRRRLPALALAADARVFVTFGAAAHFAKVYCNGNLLGSHANGYTAFTFELTEVLKRGEENLLSVELDSRETLDIPPFGNVVDYLTYGGLYRGVTMTITGPEVLGDPVISADGNGHLLISELPAGKGSLHIFLSDEKELSLDLSGQVTNGTLDAELADIRPWSPASPTLYTLTIALTSPMGELWDEKRIRIGFRTVEYRADGLYINNEKQVLRGLDRHQCWAYEGYAMPDRAQKLDADLLRFELGCTVVRTSHYPQSHAFLDRCDEIGLLVFTEIPGWQHIGGEAWKDQAVINTREMVIEYRNHPSIFLWGVRINESPDDDEFYRRTNAEAHRCDATRPTGGVRNFAKSHLFEDVYTYNDFLHSGKNAGVSPKAKITPDTAKGYLISEHNGHMFPTKSFDWEEKRLEHALRHARVIDDAMTGKDIGGVIGWCMFDYNTHRDFGSGDRICYHGVMDAFRNPKLAAAVYESQKDPGEGIVLSVSASMDIGEHPAGYLGPIYAFTNADSVRLYKNGEFLKEFIPDRKTYPGLSHPPILIDDTIGELMEKKEGYDHKKAEDIKTCLNAIAKYGQTGLPMKYMFKLAGLMLFRGMKYEDGLRLFGTYVGGWGVKGLSWRFIAVKDGVETEAQIVREPVNARALSVIADTDRLTAEKDGSMWDAATIRIRAVDQNNNRLPYENSPVTLSVAGPGKILGPSVVSLEGGAAGTYLRTTGETGEVKLTVSMNGVAPVTLSFTVE